MTSPSRITVTIVLDSGNCQVEIEHETEGPRDDMAVAIALARAAKSIMDAMLGHPEGSLT
jgi:hypothetical protein